MSGPTQGANCGWLDQVMFSPAVELAIASYATNLNLSTTASNCQAVLPDFASTGLFTLQGRCDSVIVTQAPPGGTALSVVTTKVVLTAIAPSGARVAVTNTTVVADLTPPQIIFLGVNPLILAADTNCTAAIPNLAPLVQASDNCSPQVTTLQTPPAGTVLPLGTNTVVFRADDGNGVGGGLRWYSPLGPVRVDLAFPQDKDAPDDWRVHMTLGPDL